MKRAIAILLLVVCIALPLACLAGYYCQNCGKSNARLTLRTVYTKNSQVFHTVWEAQYTHCPDCGHEELVNANMKGVNPHTNRTHYRQIIGQHAIYEYDVCNDCGEILNVHTSGY